ncbi:MAG TPA: hypothetical protein VGR48_16355 [Terriglobales bacterium]|nr:hypothetical protein [Terriglobales bacterium]
MAKRVLLALAITLFWGPVCISARAQAVAESAVMHANSGISGSVARALGGNIQQGLSKTQSRFSYPPGTPHSARRAHTHRSPAHAHLGGRSPIAISSVVGGPVPCANISKSPAPSAGASPSGNCAAKTPAPPANTKSNPNEITVSF